MSDAERSAQQERRREVLRQAGVVLEGRVVTLWEVSPQAEVAPVLTSVLNPPHHASTLDLDATLRRWGTPVIQGSRWVGCRLDDVRGWCVAPVRAQPAAPPPSGVERRSRERMGLELAGLCLGAIERPTAPRLPEPEALAELSRHPSVIAHEVANSLAAALASADVCLDSVREGEHLDRAFRAELLEDLGNVTEGIERAMGYLRSIQDRARGALARSERFNAVQVVRSCITLERPFVRRQGLGLQLDSASDAVFLQGDPNGLYQILTNLIRNAVDASPQGRGVVTVALQETDKGLQLTVRDHGVGIAAEHLERIFEPGFTTKEFGKGSGMGLTVVRELAHNMFGGTVKVDSVVGAGTVVTVKLPIPAQRAPRRT